jgi:hypothetical protein
MLPKTKDQWISFCLLPCKVYVLAVVPLRFLCDLDGHRMVLAAHYPPRLDMATLCLGYVLALAGR